MAGFSENQIEDDCFDLFVVGDAKEREDTEDLHGQMDQEPVMSEPLETERPRKNGKCNLRKSVLDPEELSIITNGLKKASPCPLPGIQEDMRRSAESNSTFTSTLESDSLTLESLEVDLFEDIRASIQRSSKASNVAFSNSKTVSGAGLENLHCNCRYKAISVLVPGKRSKEADISSHLYMSLEPAARSGEPNPSSLKPPKILGRANPISSTPTKRTANRVKIDGKAASVAGRGEHFVPSKKTGLVRSSVTSRPTLSKSSLGSSPSATKMKPTASCSSFSTSGSTSSDSTGKSPLKSLRNKTDSRNVTPVSGSTLKNPPRISSKSRTEPENSRLTAYLLSIPKPKLSSNISPASSIDGWSSESSSSTATLNQWSNGSKSNIGINSPRRGSANVGINSPRRGSASVGIDSPHRASTNVGIDSPRIGSSLRRDSHASQVSGAENPPHDDQPSVNLSVKKASMGSAPLSHPASANGSRTFKPSGLRMPSPKIGFFDAEKSLVHTPTGNLQSRSGARSGLSKTGPGTVTPKEEAIKTKASKLQPARPLRGTGSIKLDSQEAGAVHSASSKKPASHEQLQDSCTDSRKLPGASMTRTKCPAIASEVQNDSTSGTSKEKHCETREICELPNTDTAVQDTVSNADMGSEYAFKNNLGIESATVITSCKEDGPQISKERSDCQSGNIIPSENPVNDQEHLENNLHSLHKSYEKENYSCFDDQVDSLSRHVAAVDLNMDIVTEVPVKKCSSPSQFDVSNIDDHGDPKLSSSNSSTLLVHGQEDVQKISSKPNPLCLSPNTMEILSKTRIPLADNVSFCNKSESFGSESESTIEIIPSTVTLPECIQKENS
ncbi:hypothetical protein BVC80_1751g76 [Macleaya cordata]|uniref:Uncharacterized protein n=1 Tax=Macleaya cordata TaxID=56857 RepID=A0A200QHD6_MACCD|nr:hypothetical protein BVC80_1751g76 [Macleaya cordata]